MFEVVNAYLITKNYRPVHWAHLCTSLNSSSERLEFLYLVALHIFSDTYAPGSCVIIMLILSHTVFMLW